MEMEFKDPITQLRQETRNAMEKASMAYAAIAAAIEKAQPDLSKSEQNLLQGCRDRSEHFATDMRRESTKPAREIRQEILQEFFGNPEQNMPGWLDNLKAKDESGAVARWEQPIRNILSENGIR